VPAASSKEYAREKNSIGFSFSSNLKMEMISFFAQRKRGKMGEGGESFKSFGRHNERR
jgi:hypothetical protein